jgi:hypothetical protein
VGSSKRSATRDITVAGLSLRQFAAVLVISILLVGCQGAPGVVPDAEMQLHVNNGTPLQLLLVVNGRTYPLPAEGQIDLRASELPPLAWMAEIRTMSGRSLVGLTVRSGDVVQTQASQKGDGARVDLSCGRIDIWSGPPLLGPPPGAGAVGDCIP